MPYLRERAVRCFPRAREGLDALPSEGWTIGIATNGGLGEVGVRKPERCLFEAAAAECGASLSAGGWMVGDSPETDVGGARAAGLRTLWVDIGREWADGLREPGVMVPGIVEAIEVLRGKAV
ncbi:HAD family hydrolase [Streptomyces sp. 1222.5]|uniref:HAD family hydrolase n=1 Tax=Streptomyces sp. 1222.5 TaxID=1881026 RepID=UPI003D74F485